MAINLSLGELFREAFGYATDAFDPKVKALPVRKEAGKYGSPMYGRSHLGREYYMPVSIKCPIVDGNREVMLPAPVISISSSKTLIKTDLTERDSPVTEFINRNGYKINIKGFCIGQTNEFPEDQIAELEFLYAVNAPVIMRSAYSDIFLIDTNFRIVIESLNFPEMRGVQGVKAYELSAYSDEEFNLIDIR